MTFDEARLMANVNDQARRRFEDGRRARWAGPRRLGVRNGKETVLGGSSGTTRPSTAVG